MNIIIDEVIKNDIVLDEDYFKTTTETCIVDQKGLLEEIKVTIAKKNQLEQIYEKIQRVMD